MTAYGQYSKLRATIYAREETGTLLNVNAVADFLDVAEREYDWTFQAVVTTPARMLVARCEFLK